MMGEYVKKFATFLISSINRMHDHANETMTTIHQRVTNLEVSQPENGNMTTFLTSKKRIGIQMSPNKVATSRPKEARTTLFLASS
jgi:hypothetical protein